MHAHRDAFAIKRMAGVLKVSALLKGGRNKGAMRALIQLAAPLYMDTYIAPAKIVVRMLQLQQAFVYARCRLPEARHKICDPQYR